jgi:hypothetical protein
MELGSSGPGQTKVYNAHVVGSSGSATVRMIKGHAELVVHHFQPSPAGLIYEGWLARGNRKPQPTSAPFSVTASGDGDIAADLRLMPR